MKINKGLKKISTLYMKKIICPRYRHWINVTESCLNNLLKIKQNRVYKLLWTHFNFWKREILVKKLISMFSARKVFRAFHKIVEQSDSKKPNDFWIYKSKWKCWKGFQLFLKGRWEKRKAHIIGKEIMEKHSQKLQKNSLIGILENVVRIKKY